MPDPARWVPGLRYDIFFHPNFGPNQGLAYIPSKIRYFIPPRGEARRPKGAGPSPAGVVDSNGP
eukprot:NODE_1025_length_1092_cov_91.510067_g714_i0.p3 GENE.NODE_1025_length_1092_cov_91.510067_g714_i0~~NODE_1025_length_1092_cov_91.510067_g714_i0.p3  ORF type:complete len:64 (+),score=2.01 NODE_1025_length_1092_cov_91.510067_g714_i0:445-636(+)